MTPGLVVGAVVVLGPAWLELAVRDAALASRSRRHNGLHESAAHREYFEALAAALAAVGHTAIPETPEMPSYPQQLPTVPVTEAAERLGLSQRQCRRLAPRLGGKRVGGRWFLDDEALREHEGGTTR